jgi:hypothetical protein
MIEVLLTAAAALADLLEAENTALAGVDYGTAVRLAGEKRRAADAFAAAWTDVRASVLSAEQRAAALSAAARLRDLADANRRSLERAITVQGRVIECVLRAAALRQPVVARYGATGAMASATRAVPLTVLGNA